MTQASTKKASSRLAHADSPSARPIPLTVGWPRLKPLARFWIAVVIVAAASVLAVMQSPRSDALRPPRWFTSTAWWRYPLEWNAADRLPKIECSLKAIQAVPNSTSIWAVGNKGMVVNSADGGKTWTKKGIETGQLSPAGSPSPRAGSTQSFLDWPDLIPTAAAVQESSAQRPPPTQSGTPIPSGLNGKEVFNSASATPDPKSVDTRQQALPTPEASPSPVPSAYPSSTPTAVPQPSPYN
jgi:hypothetical protein